MAVKIRLKRMGKIRAPFYRVVVMDSRAKRDGRAIEEMGKYHPTEEPSLIDIDGERAQYWLSQGAQPTEAVVALFKVTGDWQKFKGEPGAEGTLKVKAPKPSKKDLYEAAVAAAGKGDAGNDGATTPKKKAAAVKAEEKADQAADKADKAAKAEDKAAQVETEAVAPNTEDIDAPAAALLDATPDAVKAEKAAEEADGVPAKELPEGAVAANEDGSSPDADYAVKGNADSGKYHEPDGQWYGQTVAEFWFKNAEDAEKAGFVKAGS